MEPTNTELLAAIEALHALHARHEEMMTRSAEAEETHTRQHVWLEALISREEAKAAFWRNLADKSVPYIVGAVAVAALTGAWHAVAGRFGWG